MIFPAFKLSLLFIKQFSKHIANNVKDQAKAHPRFRSGIIRFAQAYHRLDVRLTRRQADIRPDPLIIPLDDNRAIDLAANFIGESIIFSVAALALLLETYRKKLDDMDKDEKHRQQAQMITDRIDVLEAKIAELKKREK